MNLLRPTLILCLLFNQCIMASSQHESTCQSNSTFTTIFIGGVILTGAVLAAPLVLPAGTVATLSSAAAGTAAAIKTTAAAISVKAAAAGTTIAAKTVAAGTAIKTAAVTVGTAGAVVAPVLTAIDHTVTVANIVGERILPGQERQLALLKNKVDHQKSFNDRLLEKRESLAKEQDLRACLSSNINLTEHNEYGVPYPCIAIAEAFAQVAGSQEMQKIKNSIYA